MKSIKSTLKDIKKRDFHEFNTYVHKHMYELLSMKQQIDEVRRKTNRASSKQIKHFLFFLSFTLVPYIIFMTIDFSQNIFPLMIEVSLPVIWFTVGLMLFELFKSNLNYETYNSNKYHALNLTEKVINYYGRVSINKYYEKEELVLDELIDRKTLNSIGEILAEAEINLSTFEDIVISSRLTPTDLSNVNLLETDQCKKSYLFLMSFYEDDKSFRMKVANQGDTIATI